MITIKLTKRQLWLLSNNFEASFRDPRDKTAGSSIHFEPDDEDILEYQELEEISNILNSKLKS